MQVEQALPTIRLRDRDANCAPLSDQELDELHSILASAAPGIAMGIETLDGFFSGLLVGPPVQKPCEYWPVVLGKNQGDSATLDYIRSTTLLLPLLARHWEAIARTLEHNKITIPLLVEDDLGVARGCDWARGFLRAVQLRAEAWSSLIASDEDAVAVLPMMILAHEDDPSPQLRCPPISPTRRREIIKLMVAGASRAHRYFSHRHVRCSESHSLNLN